MFISTVRTSKTCSVIESRNSDPSELDFAFLSDPRFLNTAFTRAQSFLAVVGDPMSLCSVGKCRGLWKNYLERCEHNKGLHGCTLKDVMDFCLRSLPLDPNANEFTPKGHYEKDETLTVTSEGKILVLINESVFNMVTLIQNGRTMHKNEKLILINRHFLKVVRRLVSLVSKFFWRPIQEYVAPRKLPCNHLSLNT